MLYAETEAADRRVVDSVGDVPRRGGYPGRASRLPGCCHGQA